MENLKDRQNPNNKNLRFSLAFHVEGKNDTKKVKFLVIVCNYKQNLQPISFIQLIHQMKGVYKNWLYVTSLFSSIHISAFGKGSKSQEIIVDCLYIQVPIRFCDLG